MTAAPPPQQVSIVADGVFGDQMAAALTAGLVAEGRRAGRRSLDLRADHERLFVEADVTVLLTGRHDWPTLDRFDAASHGTRRPWLSVTHQHPYVRVGPYVTPFQGPCQRCLRMRLVQHDRLDRVSELAGSAPEDGAVRGLPPHAAVTSAALALALVSGVGMSRREGVMFLVHVDGLEISRVPIIAAHLCPRCGEGIHRPPTRSPDRIRAVLSTERKGR